MKKGKIMSIMLAVLMFTLFSMGSVFAAEAGAGGIGTAINPGGVTIGKLEGPTQKIIGAIQIVGYLIAAGMIVYIGVKYIMASASEKADLKGLAIKYVIGAVLIVFGTTIASWIFSIK